MVILYISLHVSGLFQSLRNLSLLILNLNQCNEKYLIFVWITDVLLNMMAMADN